MLNTWISAIHTATSPSSNRALLRLPEWGLFSVLYQLCIVEIIDRLLDYSEDWTLPEVRLFTGNPIRNKSGGIVMGRGAARQVRDTYLGIDKLFKTDKPVTWVEVPGKSQQWLGWFKVKHHWKDEACLDLIKESADFLAAIANLRPGHTFKINAPGIGNGKLQWSDVEPLLQVLPDSCLVYKK